VHPHLFSIGPLDIRSYGTMMALGLLAGVLLVRFRSRRRGQDPDAVVDLCVFVFIAGLLGARLLHVALALPYYMEEPLRLVKFWEGGLAFFGGPALAIPAGVWRMKRVGLPFWRTADTIVPSLALAHALGRVGCLLNGCCYGVACDLPWAIRFHNPLSVAGSEIGSVAVHPTQIYSLLGLLILLGILLSLDRARGPARPARPDGAVFCVYLIGYGLLRFAVEFVRADTPGWRLLALSPGQWASLAMLLAGVFLLMARMQSASREATEP